MPDSNASIQSATEGLKLGSRVFHIDVNRSDSYVETGSVRFPFKTITAAIAKVIANGDNSQANPYTFRIAPGVYAENLILEDAKLVSLIWIGEGSRLQTQIKPTSGLALRSNANNANFYDLHMENIQFSMPTEMTGSANGNYFGYNFFFDNCYWATTASALFKNMTYPSFNGDWTKFSGGLTISNVTQFAINGIGGFKSGAANNIIETDETANMPYGFGTLKGTSVLCTSTRTPDVTWSLIGIATMTGTALQLRACRHGGAGGTIPANVQVIAYNSALIGSFVVATGGRVDLYNSQVSGTLSGTGTINRYQYASGLANDSTLSGTTVKDALDSILGLIPSLPEAVSVLGKIASALAETATVTVTGGAGALQTAITAAVDGDVIEVQDDLVYSPITLPAGKTLIIRARIGNFPRLSGTNCIKVDNGADGHIVSGFGFVTYTTGDNNAMGAGITFTNQGSKCSDLIFHNLSFEEVTAGSAVLMSYHRSVGGDNYANPPQPSEMSSGIAFVSCRFYKACADGTEGAALLLRAFDKAFIYDNRIDCGWVLPGPTQNGVRGILLQACTNFWVEKNRVENSQGQNSEGIKIDSIGTPTAVFNTGWVVDNDFYKMTEGIDCDDDCAGVVVYKNRCSYCTSQVPASYGGEGISIDGGSAYARVLVIDNACTRCYDGIYAEAGSYCEMFGNSSWDNVSNDYRLANGYVLPASNVTTPRRGVLHMSEGITWEDLQMAGTAASVGISIRPAAMTKFRDNGAGSDGVYLPRFTQTTTAPLGTKELFFAFQIPHAFARGQHAHIHVHWAPSVTGVAGTVGWKVEYTAQKINGTFGLTGVLDLSDVVAAGDPAYKHRLTPLVDIPAGVLEESAVVVCRVYRDADTWASDEAYLLSVDLHIPQNKLGTHQQGPPWD